MANKKKTQVSKKEEKRMRTRQIVFIVFSIFVVLAMILPMIAPTP